MIKILLATIISGFLFISLSTIAADHSQTQNKVDDKMSGGSEKKDSNADKESQSETYEKQKVQKLEKDEGRYQQLKKDADLRGKTEENKGNFDTDVPRGDGVQYPPAKDPK